MDQAPEFGLPLVTVDVTRDVGRLADHAERRNRVGQLADHLELHRRIGQVLSGSRRPADRPELHRRIGQVLSRSRPPADRPELHRRIGQVLTRISQRADRPELHRRIGQVLTRSSRPADRPELHRRIGQVLTRISQRADRPELHRRIVRSSPHRTAHRSHRPAGRPHRLPRRGPRTRAGFGVGIRSGPVRTATDAAVRRLGQVAERCSGDDECVLQGPGRGRGIVKDPMGVAVQGRRVPVVRHGDARRVSRRDRRDNLAVVLAVFAWRFRRPAGG